MIEYLNGDIFRFVHKDSKVIIPHVCNNQRRFGRGFVVPLSKRFLHAKIAYLKESDLSLGKVIFVDHHYDKNIICHMIAQNGLPSKDNPEPLCYDSLDICLKKVKEYMNKNNYDTIYTIKFGSGLARGNWNEIESLIQKHWNEFKVKVFVN